MDTQTKNEKKGHDKKKYFGDARRCPRSPPIFGQAKAYIMLKKNYFGTGRPRKGHFGALKYKFLIIFRGFST